MVEERLIIQVAIRVYALTQIDLSGKRILEQVREGKVKGLII